MAETTNVQESVTDMLKVVTTAIDKMREQQSEAIKELENERKEQAKVTELLRDFVREYDRLSQRMSIQLRVLVTENEKRANS